MEELTASNSCSRCRKVGPVLDGRHCQGCRDYYRDWYARRSPESVERKRATSKRIKQRITDQRRQAGLCTRCGSSREDPEYAYCLGCRTHMASLRYSEDALVRRLAYSRRYSKEHPEQRRTTKRAYAESLRMQAVDAYGGRCVCCGEVDPAFLSFDHINGDGKQHRDEVGSGRAFYQALRREGFPDTIQLLCFNCHLAKDFRGGCPHRVAA